MRRLMKQAAAAVLMAVCLVSLSACTAKQEDAGAKVPGIATEGIPADGPEAESLKASAANTLGLSAEQMIIQKAVAESWGDLQSAELYNIQIEARHEFGEVRGIDLDNASVVILADGSNTVMIPVTFTEGTMAYVLNLNRATQEIKAEFTEMPNAEEEGKTVSVLMETATVYAAIGIGTVFTVLVFISLIISCFKFIHQWEKQKNTKNDAPAPVLAAVPAPKAPAADADLSDDAELVAVITAAIAAYEGTSSNGLVVRSIRRVQGFRRR